MLLDDVPAPINGVIFDFHATLVDRGDPDRWIAAAFRHLADVGRATPELSDTEFDGPARALGPHLAARPHDRSDQ